MMKNTIIIGTLFLGMICGGVGCEKQSARSEKDKLAAVLRESEEFSLYEEEDYPLGIHTDSIREKEVEFAESQLEVLRDIDQEQLSETEQISLELLKFQLQDQVDAYEFEMHLNPIQADQGFHLDLNYNIVPINSLKDARDYLKMLNAIPDFVEQNFVWLRQGLKKGISQPKVIFKGYESTYDQHIVSDFKASAFYVPFLQLPSILSQAQKDSILQAGQIAIETKVIPSFKAVKAFFETEYIPHTREALGVSETPNGTAYYQNRINYYTTSTAYTADEIYEIGLKEVERIRAEMEAIIAEVGFEGSFSEFLDFLRTAPQFYANTGDELMKEARSITKKIDGALPKFFKTLPRRPYGVKKVADAIAPKYTAGRYSPPAKETEPGFFMVNTYKLNSRPLYVLPALAAHEAVPGHHLQGSLNLELGDSIPEFRKDLYLSAYGEGWALYAEYLVNEMGIYETPYEQFGRLTYEMWRACRLVVDPGIHAKGWSREQVVDFMLANTALSEHEVNTETDRYIAWPGQALSYKIGELKIRELRRKAEAELGADFDIRAFHEVILAQGTVTLPILEKRVNRFIAAARAQE